MTALVKTIMINNVNKYSHRGLIMHDMRKLIMIVEGRDPEIEYTDKETKGVLDKVIATLSGTQSSGFTRVGKKYKEIDRIEKEIAAQKKQLNAETKEKMEELFDVEDEVLTRVVETASLTLTLSKQTAAKKAEYEKVSELDAEGMLNELAEMLPDLTNTLNTLRKKYTKEVERVKSPAKSATTARLSAPKFKKESVELNEGLSDWVQKFKTWASKKLSRFDSKFNKLKAQVEGA